MPFGGITDMPYAMFGVANKLQEPKTIENWKLETPTAQFRARRRGGANVQAQTK